MARRPRTRKPSADSATNGAKASAPAPVIPPESRWKFVFEATAAVVGLIGLLWGFYEYVQRREEGRVGQTLALVQLWEKEGYKASFDKIEGAIADRIDGMDDALKDALATASEKERADARGRIATNVAQQTIGGQAGEVHVDTILYFFTRLAICVESQLCSSGAAHLYFGDMTSSFWCYFQPYVESRRESGSVRYGSELERYVQQSAVEHTERALTGCFRP